MSRIILHDIKDNEYVRFSIEPFLIDEGDKIETYFLDTITIGQ